MEGKIQGEETPTMQMLLDFSHYRQKILEDLKQDRYTRSNVYHNKTSRLQRSFGTKATQSTYTAQTYISCHIYKENQFTQNCKTLLDIPMYERVDIIRKLKLCTNCARLDHTNSHCESTNCKKCNGRYQTTLHRDSNTTVPQQQSNVACLIANMSA